MVSHAVCILFFLLQLGCEKLSPLLKISHWKKYYILLSTSILLYFVYLLTNMHGRKMSTKFISLGFPAKWLIFQPLCYGRQFGTGCTFILGSILTHVYIFLCKGIFLPYRQLRMLSGGATLSERVTVLDAPNLQGVDYGVNLFRKVLLVRTYILLDCKCTFLGTCLRMRQKTVHCTFRCNLPYVRTQLFSYNKR